MNATQTATKTAKLGHTEITVSKICLGTMTWGQQNTEQEAHAQMDLALDYGIHFWDAAEMYPVPSKPETAYRTESYIGTWFAQSKKRDCVVLATKVAGPGFGGDWLSWIRDPGRTFDAKNLTQALEGSLKRLQTDYIDLYQLHWPSRKTNFFGELGFQTPEAAEEALSIPLEETLAVLKTFIEQGKIRAVGLSNETPWGTMKCLHLAQTMGLPRVVSVQNPYSLLNRTYEVGMAEVSYRENVGLLAYSPLAFGVLSGKYLENRAEPTARLSQWGDYFTRYSHPLAQEATRRYVALAKEHGLSPAQMALAFVNQQPFVSSNIIGATSLAQLEENLGSLNLSLSPELMSAINAIHEAIPNPCP